MTSMKTILPKAYRLYLNIIRNTNTETESYPSLNCPACNLWNSQNKGKYNTE
jgi:hypothetical protein